MTDSETRIASLERGLRRERKLRRATLASLCAILFLGANQTADLEDVVFGTVTVRELRVVDDRGRLRVLMSEDPQGTQRRNRSCGLTIFDTTGAERGGVATFEDLSVVLALDAPTGVGAPMRDRVGLVVSPDGAARVDLIDNDTAIAVRLVSEAEGGGGVEFFDYDLEANEVEITRMNHEGQSQRTLDMGG